MTDEYIRKKDAVDAVAFGITIVSAFNTETGERIDLFAKENEELQKAIERIRELPSADVAPVVFCKDCIHNNDCDIQYSAQAGDNFFCGFGETEKDVREDVYE